MKKVISYILLCLWPFATWAQSGNGYNPENPGDPDIYYGVTLETSPRTGGSANWRGTRQFAAGDSLTLQATAKEGFRFLHWMEGDRVVSTSRSFRYAVEERNVAFTAYFEYNPVSPDDPDSLGYSHRVRLYATPSAGGYFNSASFTLVENEVMKVYAYPRNGYTFESWMQGSTVVSTDNPMTIRMGQRDMEFTATFSYTPASPGDPAPNMFNAATGEVIIDNFQPGQLNSTLYTLVGSDNLAAVQSVTVIGRMKASDFGFAHNLENCSVIDLSRTTGYTEIPAYSFEGSTALRALYLPMNVERIGKRAFAGCSQLQGIFIYTMTPPALDEEALADMNNKVRVYVPSAAVPLFANAPGWHSLNILSLDENEKSITLNLPGESGQYKNMTLELQNTQSGQTYRYLITDRLNYTFFSLVKNTTYNAYVKNATGTVLGEIQNIILGEANLDVTFPSIKSMYDVTLRVQTPDGTDVTNDVTITWMDGKGNYMRQGNVLTALLEGTELQYRLKLSKELAMGYVQPADVAYTVNGGNNQVTCTLSPIRQITISGYVKDSATKAGVRNATVSISQTLNGKYSKTTLARTDEKGFYTATAYNAPTTLTASAYDYVSATATLDVAPEAESIEAGDFNLASVAGATINVNLTYTPSVAEGETAETLGYYQDYQNVIYSIYNLTTNRELTQVSVRYPQLVVLEGAKAGDRLSITAKSKKEAFKDVVVETEVDSMNRVNVTFPIVEWGGIRASYQSSPNTTTIGQLFNSMGYLVKTYKYSILKELIINNLPDDEYTLITMGEDTNYSSIYKLKNLGSLGFREHVDYVRTFVTIKSGNVEKVTLDAVPKLDTSRFKYIANSSLSANKLYVVAGNYLTLSGMVKIKEEYADKVSNVKLIIDIPESAVFVEESVLNGSSKTEYSVQNQQLIIPLDEKRKSANVKFCVIPTKSGNYIPNGFVKFNIDGEEKICAIGAANYTVDDIKIKVPHRTNNTNITVRGLAMPGSNVEVYDNDVIVGSITTPEDGKWSISCVLDKPYNLSSHHIHAKIYVDGSEIQSQTENCIFDINTNTVKSVTMTHYNGWYKKNMDVVFDMEKGTTTPNSYYFYTTADFSFIVDFINNDTTEVSDVYVYAKDYRNGFTKMKAVYDKTIDRWIAKHEFSSEDAPVNVSVSYNTNSRALIDRKIFDDLDLNFENNNNQLLEVVDSVEFYDVRIQKNEEQNELTRELYNKLSENEDGSYPLDLLAQYLTSIGFATDENDLKENIPEIPDDERDEYIDMLLVETDSILRNSPNDKTDELEKEYYELLHVSDSIQKNIESLVNIDEALKITNIDTIHFVKDGADWIYYELPLSRISDLGIVDTDGNEVVSFTDGSEVLMSIDDNLYVVCDSIKQRILVMEAVLHTSEKRILRKAPSVNEAIDRLNAFIRNTPNRIRDITNIIRSQIENFQTQIRDIDVMIENRQRMLLDYAKERISLVDELKRLQIECQRLDNITSVEDTYRANEVWNRRIALENRLKEVNERINKLNNRIGDLRTEQDKLGRQRLPLLTFVDTLNDLIGIVQGVMQVVEAAQACVTDCIEWNIFINNLQQCKDKGKDALINNAERERNIAASKYIGSIALSGGSSAISIYMMTNQAAGFVVKLLVNYVTDYMRSIGSEVLNSTRMDSSAKRSQLVSQMAQLDCNKEDDDEEEEETDNDPANINWDPSGYVYEGVSSNRIEGATATAYFMETTEDMYGVLHEEPRIWDAEEYAQENPLFTDENGMYQWDVPQGLWQVKFEKEGYETTYSDWLPVPPPQLDVNVAMTQVRQPEVKQAHAYKDGIEVEFDKYMLPSLLNTDNIMVSQNGEYVEGTIRLLNEEKAYNDENVTYASKVRFMPTTPFTATEVTLLVNNQVKSYAGIQMQDSYTQTFDIEQEITGILADSLIYVTYGGTKDITVSVIPADAAKGKTLNVKSSSTMIATTEAESYTLDENGQAIIQVSGELPGMTSLTFSIDGYDLTATTLVSVNIMQDKVCATPTANIPSGSEVEAGTQFLLTCATPGATIYFTDSGVCPCDDLERALVFVEGVPVILMVDVVIKAIAVAPGYDDSEVATFVYKVKGGSDTEKVKYGDIVVNPMAVKEKAQIVFPEERAQNVSVINLNGITVAQETNMESGATMDLSYIPAGVYVIVVTTRENTYTRKIVKL